MKRAANDTYNYVLGFGSAHEAAMYPSEWYLERKLSQEATLNAIERSLGIEQPIFDE